MKKLDVQVKVGYYGNVNIGVIRTNGDMVTILPMNIQKIWKVNIIDERKQVKRTNKRKGTNRCSK